MITFENVTKRYKQKNTEVCALQDITLTVAPHELFGVIGESGSGKSTLLRMINTLEQPTTGKVMVNGCDVNLASEREKRISRKKIGMIFQQFNLLYHLTVAENIALPLKLNHKYNEKKVQEVLRFVRLLDKKDQFPKQLSGGEKQRVGIARALITQPEILLCDEPTSALDGQNAYDIMALLQTINQTYGTTMVIVTHELNLIKHLCCRTAILESGRIKETMRVKSEQQPQYTSYYQRVKESLK